NNSKASVFFGHGDGTFDPRTDYAVGAGSNAIVITDLNRDGRVDLALSTTANTVTVLLGTGNGTFDGRRDYGTPPSAFNLAVGDLDGDGAPDLVTANQIAGSVALLWNRSVPTDVSSDRTSSMNRIAALEPVTGFTDGPVEIRYRINRPNVPVCLAIHD